MTPFDCATLCASELIALLKPTFLERINHYVYKSLLRKAPLGEVERESNMEANQPVILFRTFPEGTSKKSCREVLTVTLSVKLRMKTLSECHQRGAVRPCAPPVGALVAVKSKGDGAAADVKVSEKPAARGGDQGSGDERLL